MTPKGRIIIVRGTDTIDDKGHDLASYKLLSNILNGLSEQNNARFEIITTSKNLTENRERYSEMLEKEGYGNVGFINIQKKQDIDDYYSRIFAAKVVVFDDKETQICEIFENSAMLELLNKKYLYEENFTIVGINSGAMCIPGLILNDRGTTNVGLGFINNCIIDTKFMHGERRKNLVKAVICHQECLGLGLNSGMALIIEKGFRAACFGSGSIMVVNAKNVKDKRLKKGASVYKKYLKGHILTEGSVLNLLNGNLIQNHLISYNLNFTNRNTVQ